MTELQRIIAEVIYDNTVFRFTVSNSVDMAKMNIAIEELSALLGMRDKMPSEKDMLSLVQFLEKIGFDFNQLYIKNKVAANGEIVYTIGFVNNNCVVDIHIEYEKNIIHAGILVEMPIDKDGN